jgi:erythromycin esterase-like protein
LAREEYGPQNVYLAGFATYSGTVIAGEDWGANMQEMEVPPAKKGSIESMLHEQNKDGYILFNSQNEEVYNKAAPHRAIGVVYNPAMEKYGNYVPSVLSQRYDALVFIDKTKALHPLYLHPDRNKIAETFPSDF